MRDSGVCRGAVVAGIEAQEPAPAPQPQTVAISVEATGESVPVIFFNRSIVVLRASIMGRSPDERRNLAVRMMDDLVERGETGPVTVTTTEGGVLIGVGRRMITGLTEANLDPVGGEDLQTVAREAAARMQVALTEAAEARRPGVWLRGGALSLLAILVSAIILWLLGRTRRATVARLSALAGRDGFSVCARQRYGRRLGDFVRIGDVEGTITDVGLLSTKLRTLKAEEITIPNAVVVSQTTTDYSRYPEAVLTAASIAVGYNVPWRQAHALLLLAAERTPGIRREPIPRVMQLALEDVRVNYTLRRPAAAERCPERAPRPHPRPVQRVRRADRDAQLRGRSPGAEGRGQGGLVRGSGTA